MSHYFAREVVGLGNKIIIPRLNMDGRYGMSVFEKEGYCSLIAVPITTYRVLGIMGAAERGRNRFSPGFSQLFGVIANLVGMALNKNAPAGRAVSAEESPQSGGGPLTSIDNETGAEPVAAVVDGVVPASGDHQVARGSETFREHAGSMDAFRRSHGVGL